MLQKQSKDCGSFGGLWTREIPININIKGAYPDKLSVRLNYDMASHSIYFRNDKGSLKEAFREARKSIEERQGKKGFKIIMNSILGYDDDHHLFICGVLCVHVERKMHLKMRLRRGSKNEKIEAWFGIRILWEIEA